MKISIVTPTFNTIKRIERNLDEVFNPLIVSDPEIEFVIWDNGSTDGTKEYLKKLECKLGNRLKIHYCDKNVGVNIAVKWVLENTTTEHIFLFNDDYIVKEKEFYKPYLNFKKPVIASFPELSDSVHKNGSFFSFTNKQYYQYGDVKSPQCFRPIYINRQILNKVNWDDKMFYAYSDLDFMMNAMKLGFPIVWVYQDNPCIDKINGHNKERLDLYHTHYNSDTDYFYKKWAGFNLVPPEY